MTMLRGAVPRILLLALTIVTILRAVGIAQTCNPAIDGTYCAEQMGKRPDGTTSRSNPKLAVRLSQSCATMTVPSAPSRSVAEHDASAFCAGAAATKGLAKMRRTYRAAILGAAVLLAGAIAPIAAQDSKDRAVEQYSCKDIMRESGANRDVAIAFLRGFMLGKSGSTKFNLDVLHKQSDDFIERCLANPDEKAMDAMAKVIG